MIIVRVPLRIEFLGGSTDIKYFYEKYTGYVLNVAINKYINIKINSNSKNIAQNIINDRIRETLKYLKIKQGLEIISTSDVTTKGSGLGSSSSFLVGLVHGLLVLTNKKISSRNLAEIASHLEIDVLKEPIGKQDQYAASYGGINFLTFHKNGYVSRKEIILTSKVSKKLKQHLMLFYTGKTRSASNILKDQKKNINRKIIYLKQMRSLVKPATKVLEKGDLELFAQFLEKEWTIKKNLGKGITNASLEKMYRLAKQAGAWGGRVSGAGGGGFMLLIVPPNKHKKVKIALKKYIYTPISFTKKGSEIIFHS